MRMHIDEERLKINFHRWRFALLISYYLIDCFLVKSDLSFFVSKLRYIAHGSPNDMGLKKDLLNSIE